MKQRLETIWCGVLILPLMMGTAQLATGAEAPMVTVRLSSGRVFTAAIDGRTDAATLWLRFDAPGGMLLRPVDWNHVQSAREGETEMAAAELKMRWPALVSRVELSDGTSDEGERSPVTPDPNRLQPAVAEAPASLRTVQADAYVAHWGANVEADGILLRVWPLDSFGRVTPVDGTLEVELIADYRSYLRPHPITQREPFSRVGSWTFRLTEADFAGGNGATVRLPFQAIDPQFTPKIDSYGLVTLKLAVPGQGVFASSVDDVRIRPLGNIRTRIENSTGTRFYPGEPTGRPVPSGTWSF